MFRKIDAGRPQRKASKPPAVRRQDGQSLSAHDRDRLAQEHDAVGGDVEHSIVTLHHPAHHCLGRVVLVQELKTRIEAGERGHDGQREVAAQCGAFADAISEAQDRDATAGGTQRKLLRQLLHLEQVALEAVRGPIRAGRILGHE